MSHILALLGLLAANHAPAANPADDPKPVVLTGTWSQTEATGCEGLEPVRELIFSPDRFAVTFTPFETYVDYWEHISLNLRPVR